jgi:NAD(P)H-dependent flavin oxidoreductase YrpB (nitropropane dioxygenase family)
LQWPLGNHSRSFVGGKKDDYAGGLAGQVSGLIKEIKPARQVTEEIVEKAVEILTHLLPETVKAK